MRSRRAGRFRSSVLLAAAAGATACSSDAAVGPAEEAPRIAGNAVQGLRAFEEECAACHSARDAFDLAFFAFPDTTIVRRAVAHVDTATAHDIVAYVRTVRALPTSRNFRPFQPGGSRAAGDAAFATQLFAADAWPPDMTAERLATIDPLDVPVAIAFPKWSVEFSNMDWMPDTPLDERLLDYRTPYGAARPHLEDYHETHAESDLLLAVLNLRIAEREAANPDAPCVMEPFDRFRPEECFEVRRWIASLAGQHMLRSGRREALHPILHDAWWDVGNAARRSIQTAGEIDHALDNWAQWMYLGWAFEPDRHASVYLGLALEALGMPRHATFHTLRALVDRGPSGRAPFMDVRNAARFSPPHWTFDATRFGLEHLLDRFNEGRVGLRDPDDIDGARQAVLQTYIWASRKISSQSRRAELLGLVTRVVTAIDALQPSGA